MKNICALLVLPLLLHLASAPSHSQAEESPAPTPSATQTPAPKREPRFKDGNFGEPQTTTPSGLGYTILKTSEGDAVKAGDRVKVHYTGYFKDGKIFDSSLPRGETLTFELGGHQVIKGWDEGVEGMKIGEQRLLFIPSKLAYGRRGVGPIPPDTDLFFEVEVVGVEP